MMIELDLSSVSALAIPLAGVFFGLYGRAIKAENDTLRQKVEALEKQHEIDIERIDDEHHSDVKRIEQHHADIWNEIKCQREALAQNREAVLKLDASINRLNELLLRIEQTMNSKISKQDCELIRQNYLDRRRLPSVPQANGSRKDDLKTAHS